ncbi:MAG: helix-turn-helix transcriptional regulator [Clostridia bacterium]
MAIGERIRYIRNLRKMTQKWFGVKLRFTERTAETRVGQYETGVRTPKEDMINEMANIFGVAPQALNLPNIDNYDALLHTLFAIEDIYGLTINTLDDELCLTLDRENSSYFSMYDMLKAWNKVSRKYKAGEITKEEYDNWRYNYPRIEAEQTRENLDKLRSQNKILML